MHILNVTGGFITEHKFRNYFLIILSFITDFKLYCKFKHYSESVCRFIILSKFLAVQSLEKDFIILISSVLHFLNSVLDIGLSDSRIINYFTIKFSNFFYKL